MTATTFNGIAKAKHPRGRQRLREVAYKAVKDAVLKGVLNTDLPIVEERLAEALGISRTPVREALIILEHEGLIESVPPRGLFVKELSLHDYRAMCAAMETAEPTLARLAARYATPQDIASMEATLERATAMIPRSPSLHLAACREFVQHLGRCARNAPLTSFIVSLEERSDLYLISTHPTYPADKMEAAVANRRAILDAVRTGDEDAAAQAARDHAGAIAARWGEFMQQSEDS